MMTATAEVYILLFLAISYNNYVIEYNIYSI